MTHIQTNPTSPPELHFDFQSCVQEAFIILTEPAKKRQAFDPALATHRDKAQAELDTAVQALYASHNAKLEQNGLQRLRINKEGRVSIKSPEGQSAVYDALINHILSAQGATQTQTTIREAVQAMHPNHAVPKDWTKPLPAWKRQQLKTRIGRGSHGNAFASIKLNPNTTLSSLHSAAKAALQRQQDGFISFTAKITISDDTLTIGSVSVKISSTKSGGKSYQYARVNANELLKHFSG